MCVVRSEHFTDFCFIVDMQAVTGSRTQKEAWRKMLSQLYCLSISIAVPRMLSERGAKRAEKKQVGGISY